MDTVEVSNLVKVESATKSNQRFRRTFYVPSEENDAAQEEFSGGRGDVDKGATIVTLYTYRPGPIPPVNGAVDLYETLSPALSAHRTTVGIAPDTRIGTLFQGVI
ncbi:MAG: hypothetical protein NUW37_18395 [Planctomycetes bacterium]|nr:hypothetical protein [Planctomycetota bacterium]